MAVRSLLGNTGTTLDQQRFKVPKFSFPTIEDPIIPKDETAATSLEKKVSAVPATTSPIIPTIQNPVIPQRVSGGLFSSSSTAAPALAGLQAGQGVPVGTDKVSSLLSVGAATATGAATGAVVGGPIGALVGGGVGFLSSALNSYLSVRSENKRKREMEKFIKEVEAKQAKEKAQARSDQFLALKFDRKDTERTQAINTFTTKRQMLLNAVNSNQNLKNQFIQTGIR